ncbi:MAG: lysophospholipid acyltransferase family protein [Bacteroidales bacterium]|nr:lysophospholipid acyltransferase family protein [Bacteroidales bacterium]
MSTETKPALLLSRRELQDALGVKGVLGKCITSVVYSVLGVGKLNKLYAVHERPDGPDFSIGLLEELGVKYEILPEQMASIPAEGGFITVSNHPFGAIDGLILSATIGKIRPDYKILTTYFLSLVRNLKGSFIPVDNFSSGKARSVRGIKETLGHIQSGKALGLFPAGEVATWQKKADRTAVSGGRVIEDKPWTANMMKLVKKSGLPVIPVYFDGTNSRLFHRLGRIHPLLRTLRLPREMIGANGKVVKVRIGKPIAPARIAPMDEAALGKFLRSACYSLEYQCLPPKAAAESAGAQQPIAPAVDPTLIRSQVAALDHRMVFETGDYRAYLLKADEAPALMKELYRLREITYRDVGEGTGMSEDTDVYDTYYSHLILWSKSNEEIVGSYRVGYGEEILREKGIEGFYTATLLDYGPDAPGILSHSMELGRSFIVPKYQRDVLPLKMMLGGLCVATIMKPHVDCCVGLVSISEAMPDFLKSILVRYLDRDYRMDNPDSFAKATNPLKPEYLRVDPDGLLQLGYRDIDALDRILADLSDGKYRMPVLVRKYFSCGARAVCFNVDPSFSNSLDVMIVLRLKDFPPASIRSFVRGMPQETQDKVFMNFYGKVDA